MPAGAPIPLLDREDWHPGLRRIHDHWEAIRPVGRRLPGRQHLDPAAIPPDLLPLIWMLDVQRHPFRLKYRLIGTRIQNAMGRPLRGMWLDEAHAHVARNPDFLDRYVQVVETGQPSRRKGKPKLWLSDDVHLIENLLLPLAKDGENPDIVLILTIIYFASGKEL